MDRFPALLPELILSIGGPRAAAGRRRATRPARRSALVSWLAIVLLLARTVALRRADRTRAPCSAACSPADAFAGFAKLDDLCRAAAVAMVAAPASSSADASMRAEYPVLVAVRGGRHERDGLGDDLMTLYVGLELQQPRDLRPRLLPAHRRPLGRGRPQIFRPRRAGLRHPALRHLPALRLHRHDQLRRHRRRARPRRPVDRRAVRHRLRARRPGLQDQRGAVPHVDARRLRRRADAGHGVLRHARPRSPPIALVARVCDRGFRPGDRGLAADRDLRRARLDRPRRARRHRPDATSSGCSPIRRSTMSASS